VGGAAKPDAWVKNDPKRYLATANFRIAKMLVLAKITALSVSMKDDWK
jgi:hypothetical protein